MTTENYFDVESSSMHSTDSDTAFIVTEDFDTVQVQRRVLFILNKILSSEYEEFKLTKSGKYTKTGYLLEEAVNSLSELKVNISEYQQVHPTIKLFSTVLKVYNLTELSTSRVDTINSVLKLFREGANSIRHKRLLRNFQRAASKNLKGALDYVNHLFEYHSRLLVVRVDLSYQKKIVKSKTVPVNTTRLHCKRLFKRIKSHPLFEHCLGYIWKLEYGQYKGFHYHTCFFFDGSKVRGDVSLARRIGEFWKNEITEGKGLYFNCNAIANGYAHSGIGDIHYTNEEKRHALQRAITYITKVDTAVRLSLPQGARTFGRSECILRNREKRGRPRHNPA
ncbi:YagK/YfjJ domain-containing protein [Pantoea sp. RHCKP32]|uniref:YagK/YfjJ domain-containing protein n=1 Tax=Pantoea sp. RHCKP32 TaxID=3425182 RepID=UPI003DA0E040